MPVGGVGCQQHPGGERLHGGVAESGHNCAEYSLAMQANSRPGAMLGTESQDGVRMAEPSETSRAVHLEPAAPSHELALLDGVAQDRHADDRVGVALVRREGQAGDPWNHISFPGGKLVFDPFRMSYGAHCPAHPSCRVNRVVSKRPIGFLVAWLSAADSYADAKAHRQAKTRSAPGEPVCLERRQLCHDYFKELPGSAEWLAREPPCDGQEEPDRI